MVLVSAEKLPIKSLYHPTGELLYCSHCRKSSASLFDAFVMIPKTAMKILTGKENLTEHSIKGDSGYKASGTRVVGWCENPKDSAMFDGVGSLTMGIGTLDVPMKKLINGRRERSGMRSRGLWLTSIERRKDSS